MNLSALLTTKSKQHGFSLVELMISMVLGLAVVGMMISLYTSSIVNNNKIINQGKLNLEMKNLIELMSRDIRRAGYWGGATSSALSSDFSSNLYNSASAALAVSPDKSCITFAYDMDSANPEVTAQEYIGYKLQQGSVYIRSGLSPCGAESHWTQLTNDAIYIDNLAFNLTKVNAKGEIGTVPSEGLNTLMSTVTINLKASLKSDRQKSITLDKTVLVRNQGY
ncbi:prepilin-type N-terminal cleavage/methylation domain-containing protein [Motilimonas sp. 1_MG-2023]|uniref:prepilin-type N-terminal cleavage/methylation domain-containing protein n=1 Tax=Motilimonas sp. 1_MG-2023 TaxID=3062672 RepID=UPI0026E42530|nr:prepilin-type N-terminal cleavage/methylation domain-containing protein [Motilimonas sp. 1_MG-2023]MDO6526447.1 prepilin-type N-terminal cleavage/methylation domain-containing protein [Motilimonas sp. 1_MG-2023]